MDRLCGSDVTAPIFSSSFSIVVCSIFFFFGYVFVIVDGVLFIYIYETCTDFLVVSLRKQVITISCGLWFLSFANVVGYATQMTVQKMRENVVYIV